MPRKRAAPPPLKKERTPSTRPKPTPPPEFAGFQADPAPSSAPAAAAVPTSRRFVKPRTEYAHFAERVQAAMKARSMSHSDLARAIWGSVTDYRGYQVARNRDRIGHYLAGLSYPEPDNLKKLAEVLHLSPEELAIDTETARKNNPGPARDPKGIGESRIEVSGDGTRSFVQLKRFFWTKNAVKLLELIAEDDAMTREMKAATNGDNDDEPADEDKASAQPALAE